MLSVDGNAVLSRYIDDEKLSRDAFDDEGYYKTGDLAELRDGQYYFTGRENSDCKSSFSRVEGSVVLGGQVR